MQIIADLTTMEINGGRMQVVHEKESANFVFTVLRRGTYEGEQDTFLHINRYWSQLSIETQKKIFDIYKRVEDHFDDIMTTGELTAALKQATKELFDLHPYRHVRNWLINHSGLQVPEGFHKVYIENPDRKTTPEKTYLYDDYRDLMALSLILRIMVPIWSNYVRLMRTHAGNYLKELQAFKLLEWTEIPGLPVIDKLHNYIRANLGKDMDVVPVKFISEDDQPYWVMTLICVRKICVGDLNPTNPQANLVTLVSNYIKIKSVYSTDGDFQKRENIRKTDGEEASDERFSVMEVTRTSTEITVLDAEELKLAVDNIYKVADLFFPLLPKELLEDALRTVRQTNRQEISNLLLPPQKMLVTWVMKRVIPPQGIAFLEMDAQLNCMALTQAALTHAGHPYLALLSTAYASKVSHQVHTVNTSVGRSRVPESLLLELRKHFPHVRVTESRKSAPRETCFVTNDIDEACVEFGSRIWRATANPELYRQVLGESVSRQVHITPDIRIRLMELAVDIGSGNFFNPKR